MLALRLPSVIAGYYEAFFHFMFRA